MTTQDKATSRAESGEAWIKQIAPVVRKALCHAINNLPSLAMGTIYDEEVRIECRESMEALNRMEGALLSTRSAPTDEKALIEHCASLAVAYMQDQPSWDGTAADCGYLREAIVNGDHSTLLAHEAPKDGSAKTVPMEMLVSVRQDLPVCATYDQIRGVVAGFGYTVTESGKGEA
jgi:hypothetical protein